MALLKLPNDIERIAEQIGKIQRLMGKLYQTKNIETADQFLRQKQQRWSSQDGVYGILPDILRTIAADLRNEFRSLDKKVGVKRYDSLRDVTLRLLTYVESHTETQTPHYGLLIDILGPMLEQHVELQEIPDFLKDVDALTHFYSRAKKYGFRA